MKGEQRLTWPARVLLVAIGIFIVALAAYTLSEVRSRRVPPGGIRVSGHVWKLSELPFLDVGDEFDVLVTMEPITYWGWAVTGDMRKIDIEARLRPERESVERLVSTLTSAEVQKAQRIGDATLVIKGRTRTGLFFRMWWSDEGKMAQVTFSRSDVFRRLPWAEKMFEQLEREEQAAVE